ncbi:MAG TPA: hypothetical protein VMV24_02955 [Candidatus Dormibacteraeota bacterium]|nr:hypothetical protein [Candidatus Dormibacteraeota bacterium]
MYSGFTLTDYSGKIIGAHQKIDKVAREHLGTLINGRDLFPSDKSILRFEGRNGPDGLKRKSPGKNEPEHYFSPFDDDGILIKIINDHYKNLVHELEQKNSERVAFEAAWLAHSLVDGLTPAHHYPYQEELSKLLEHGKTKDQLSVKEKLIMPGLTVRDMLKNNWKMWGPKGLMFTHGLFELGAAVLLAPLSFDKYIPSKNDIELIKKIGLSEYFINQAREIAVLDIYDIYSKRGWTPKLAKLIRNKLGPSMIRTVTLAWYLALYESGTLNKK